MPAEFPPQPSAGSDEQKSEQEQLLDTVLEALLSEQAVRINEGNNGVIFRVSFEELPNAVVHYVAEKYNGLAVDKDQVIKTLKVYTPGAGRHEFEMQRTAWQTVRAAAAAHPDKEYAHVPTPMLDRDLPVSDETREWLKQQGIRAIGNKAEVLLMDYVPGHDLATMLYRELVRRHPKLSDHAYRVDLPENDRDAIIGFEQLEMLIAERLSFAVPGGKARDAGERAYEQRKVESANMAMIITELKKYGFELHRSILKQIKNTVDLLNQDHLFLRDFHLRNAMVVGDPSAAATTQPQAYIIDFGSAVKDESLTPDEMSRPGEGVQYMRDDSIVRQLQPLLPAQQK